MDETEKLTIVNSLIEKFKNNIAVYHENRTTFNEAATRTEYIDPFLKLLGWDVNNEVGKSFAERDIVPEEPANSTDRPDYTAKMNAVDVLFIEAKKPFVNIFSDPEPAKQVRRYGWNAGHKVSVLTNFEYLSIYETTAEPEEEDSVSSYRYKVYHFEEYAEKFKEIHDLISYNSFKNGNFEDWTNSIVELSASTTSLDSVFLNQLNEWRLMIGNDLYLSEKIQYQNSKKINTDVQTFLNQLIFLRFAEDNNFEPWNNLLNKHMSQEDFVKLLNDSELKYNSGIFVETDIINSLSTKTITSIVSQLYYPKSSYDFKIINLLILGTIYENFLQYELVVEEGIVVLAKTKQAKIKSIVPTPEPMVRYIVKKALKDIIIGKSPEEILNLRIGDLAVGSGTFLIGTFDFIEDYLVDWYATDTDFFPTKSLVPYQLKREIIENVLIGFDIDPHAVQLTKFSLLLRLLRNEKKERFRNTKPILPSLDNSIICGNSLVNENSIDLTNISLEEHIEINPMEMKFSDLVFDIILGNPPYLKKEDIFNAIPLAEQEVYNTKYVSSFEMYDKYFLFVESALNKISPMGKIVFLIPNKFKTVKAGKQLRKILVDTKSITEIVDFGDIQLFRGKLTYLAVITLGKNLTDKLKYGKVTAWSELENVKMISFPLSSLEEDTWFLTNNSIFANQYIGLLNFPKITDEYNVFTGIQSSRNNIYVFDDSEILSETDDVITYIRNNIKIPIEKSVLQRFYKPGKKGAHYSYQPLKITKRIIFPYSNGVLFDINTMKTNFPNTWTYLQSKRKDLMPHHLGGNRKVPSATMATWYQYGRTQNLSIAEYQEKIMVGVLSKMPNFNIDRSQTLFESGGTAGYIGISVKESSQYTNEFLIAWLSHPLSDNISKIFGSNFDGGYYSRGKKDLIKMPLIPIDFSDDSEKEKMERITILVNNIYNIMERLDLTYDQVAINALQMRKRQAIQLINRLIDELLIKKGLIIRDE